MSKNFAFLQVLRAAAALLVVGDHAIYYLETKYNVPAWAHNLAWHIGTFGVDIFFVISGFIMAYTAKGLFDTRWGWAIFARRRIIRIVPMYWVATAFELLLAMSRSAEPHASSVLHSLFFIPQVTEPGQPLRPILGVGWTLNHEMFFYALFAVALAFRRRIGIAVVVLGLSGFVLIGGFAKSFADTSDPVRVFTFLSNPLILLFGAGVLVAVVMNGAAAGLRLRFAGPLSLILIVAGAILFMVAVDRAPWPLSWQLIFWTVSIAIVMLGVLEGDREHRYWLGWMVRLGDASYSIYLFHFIVIAALGRAWYILFPAIEPITFVVLALVVVSVTGWVIHLTVERPMLHTLRRVGSPAAALGGTAVDRIAA